MQTKLASLGFYTGAATGRLDEATISAMNDFQKLFGQAETQRITPNFLNELNSAKAVTVAPEPTPEPAPEPVSESIPESVQEEASAEAPTLEASLTPAEIKIETPTEVEPKLAPELIVNAKKIKSAGARYPIVAERRGHNKNAVVLVSYDVDVNGKVINAVVKESTGVGRFKKAFERSAISAAEKAEFSAKTVNGKAVISKDHETKFTFNIE